MDLREYILHSGGAEGSDIEWDNIGKEYGLSHCLHYYHDRKTPHGNIRLKDSDIEEGWSKVLLANKSLKRRPDNYKSLLSRNWFQVKNSDTVFAISSLKNDKEVDRGTGWAVQMAIDSKKPVFVYDQLKKQWYEYCYSRQCFAPCDIPLLTKNFAGIGTRDINSDGLKAIKDVYINTLKLSTI